MPKYLVFIGFNLSIKNWINWSTMWWILNGSKMIESRGMKQQICTHYNEVQTIGNHVRSYQSMKTIGEPRIKYKQIYFWLGFFDLQRVSPWIHFLTRGLKTKKLYNFGSHPRTRSANMSVATQFVDLVRRLLCW